MSEPTYEDIPSTAKVKDLRAKVNTTFGQVFTELDARARDWGTVANQAALAGLADADVGDTATLADGSLWRLFAVPATTVANWHRMAQITDVGTVDLSGLVHLAGSETVTGAKNFAGGLTINGSDVPTLISNALQAFSITGQYLGSATTFTGLPATDATSRPASNGDWATLTAAVVGTGTTNNPQYPAGAYVYNGASFSFAFSFGALATSGLLPANNLSDLNNAAMARSNLGLGTAAVQPTSAFEAAGAAASAQTAAQSYTDAQLKGLALKDPVRAAATSNVVLATPGSVFDTVTFTNVGTDAVLLAGQTDTTQNGLYTWNGASTALTRRPDADTSLKMKPGLLVVVTDGSSANRDKAWELQTEGPINLGVTPLTFGLASTGTGGLATQTALDAEIARAQAAEAARATALLPTVIKSGTYAAAANELVAFDTTSSAGVLNLPAAPPNGTRCGGKIVTQGGANGVTINCTGSDAFNKAGGPTSSALTTLGESAELIYVSGVWTKVANDLPLSQLTTLFASKTLASSLVGGRTLVAFPRSTAGFGSSGVPVSSSAMIYMNSNSYHRTAVVVNQNCSDLRLAVGAPISQEVAMLNPMGFRAAIEVAGVVYQATFNGSNLVTLSGDGVAVTDPIPVDIAAGTTIYARIHSIAPFGTNTGLAAAASVGATTVSVTVAPPSTTTYPMTFAVDVGANQEALQIASVSGSGPYTYTLVSGTTVTKAHASGVICGNVTPVSYIGYNDKGDALAQGGTTDYITGGTFGTTTLSTSHNTALAAAASAGDTVIVTTGLVSSPTLIVDTGGTPETVTVKQVQISGSNFRHTLTAPLTGSHASAAVVQGSVGFGTVLGPVAVIADRVVGTAKKTIFAVGDSIASQTGYGLRSDTSFIDLGLSAAGYPYIKTAISGETMASFATLASSVKRRKFLSMCDWLLIEYSTNDISLNNATLSALQGYLQTLATVAHNRGVKVALTTCLPRTNSTDFWTTTVNQTLGMNTTNEATRKAYNVWVRSGASGYIDMPIDMASVFDAGLVAGGAENGLTVVDANGPYTYDGLHPNALGHQRLANYLATFTFS